MSTVREGKTPTPHIWDSIQEIRNSAIPSVPAEAVRAACHKGRCSRLHLPPARPATAVAEKAMTSLKPPAYSRFTIWQKSFHKRLSRVPL